MCKPGSKERIRVNCTEGKQKTWSTLETVGTKVLNWKGSNEYSRHQKKAGVTEKQ